MSTKSFLFQFSHCPESLPIVIQEGVEAALMTVAFEQPVTLLFRGEGRVLLDTESMASIPGLAELLELAREIWVESGGADPPAVAKAIESEQCAALLSAHPVVMQF